MSTRKSASSWGCELKLMIAVVIWQKKVSLFVRLWVEISGDRPPEYRKESASSWGCELKLWTDWRIVQNSSQPLREAVSWNVPRTLRDVPSFVSLFVRLWVEILTNICMIKQMFRQPLREAVSWNKICLKKAEPNQVSLFVRLWVEIYPAAGIVRATYSQPLREAVSWNERNRRWDFAGRVSLFVRLWVEMRNSAKPHQRHLVSLFVRLWVEICFQI